MINCAAHVPFPLAACIFFQLASCYHAVDENPIHYTWNKLKQVPLHELACYRMEKGFIRLHVAGFSEAKVRCVLGTRPSFAPFQVRRFIQENFAVPAKNFTLHRHWPEDFLVIFRNAGDLQRVLDAPPSPNVDMVLRFRRWSRLSMAEGETMRFRVLLEIR